MDEPLSRAMDEPLSKLPTAIMYERSYEHDATVTHVACMDTNRFVTGSADGHVKLWERTDDGLQLVEDTDAHCGCPVRILAVAQRGPLFCTSSVQNSVSLCRSPCVQTEKTLSTPFVPGCMEFVGEDQNQLVVSDCETSLVNIYDLANEDPVLLRSGQIRDGEMGVMQLMKYNMKYGMVISAAASSARIFFWNHETFDSPDLPGEALDAVVGYQTSATSIAISPDGEKFAVGSPIYVFIFEFSSRNLIVKFPCGRQNIGALLQFFHSFGSDPELWVRDDDREEILHLEEEMENTETAPASNIVFDSSSECILFATLRGIMIWGLEDTSLVRTLGYPEKNIRFLRIALYQDRHGQLPPALVCTAFDKKRIYLFSHQEPKDPGDPTNQRDVNNDGTLGNELPAAIDSVHPDMILRTTMGDIRITLYHERCPLTVARFIENCRNGIYNGLTF